MRPVRAVALLAATVLVASGCAQVGRQRESMPDRAYERLLDRWTRSGEEYDRLETRLYVSATYRSWPFREAYVAQYARIFLLPDREREALRARETASFEQFHEFVLSAYTPYRQTGDFLSRTGIWRLYLEGPTGLRVATSRVDRVAEPPQVVSAFYPYVDRWSRVFLVRFPRRTADGQDVLPDPERDPFRLLITSTIARAELAWTP